MKWFRVYSEIKDDPKMLEMEHLLTRGAE